MNSTPSLSIIICTADRHESLQAFLQSLSVQTKAPDELIIIDAGVKRADNGIKSFSQTVPFKVHYIHSEERGLTKQRNKGIAVATGDILCFFDDDVVLDNKYLEVILSSFIENQNIGGITGKILNSKQNPSKLDRILKRILFLSASGRGIIKWSGFPEHKIGDQKSVTQVLSGCNMCFRRHICEKEHFDENISGYSYMEDVDFSIRASRIAPLYYNPDAKCYHNSTTHTQQNTYTLRKMMVTNHWYFFIKNQPKDVTHLWGFLISLFGLLIYNGLYTRDFNGFRGIFDGTISCLKSTFSIKI